MIGRYNKRNTGRTLVVCPPLMKLGRAEPETPPMLDLLKVGSS